ncbi:MAG TPA: tetratricopeptide repeat protein [Anaerolineae bacterium]|nr:tetratricopeptide repeat protein [Anaerolineae bacterium]
MAADTPVRLADLQQQLADLTTHHQYAEAIAIARQCQDVIRQREGESNLDYAEILERLAALYRTIQDYANAETLLLKAYDIRAKISGAAAPDAIQDLFALASLYELKQNDAAAREMYRRAINLQRSASHTFGVPPPVVAPPPSVYPTESQRGGETHKPVQPTVPISTTPSAEIKRYGRVEYYSPMEVKQEYPLRVGVLLERHGIGIRENARVVWTSLRIHPTEPEPILQIIPVATFLTISPPQRSLKVKQNADVFADFKIIALEMPTNGTGKLEIEIEYQGELVRRLSLQVTIQDQIKIGKFHVPRALWSKVSLVIGAILTLPGVISVFNLFSTVAVPFSGAIALIGFIFALPLLGLGVMLWHNSGERVNLNF